MSVKIVFAESSKNGSTLPEEGAYRCCVAVAWFLCIVNTVDDLWLEWHFVRRHHLVFQ